MFPVAATAQLTCNFTRIDGITSVVPRMVFHIGNQLPECYTPAGCGAPACSNRAHSASTTSIVRRSRYKATDIISFTESHTCYYLIKSTSMILHIESLANLITVTVDRQRFTRKCADDHQQDQFFQEMIST
ncbi:MAG: hypothetical protein HNEKOMLI_00343 [Sodalis sp. Psp]|nr:hypothetical protein [Sodalis sp. Psp]MCR3756833.1 hypothetical protein [Sodalis sp. Ppy]